MKKRQFFAKFLPGLGIQNKKGNATVVAIIIVLVAMSSSVITWLYAKKFQGEGVPVTAENEKTSVILTENAKSTSALKSGVFYGNVFAGTRFLNENNEVVMVDSGKEFVVDKTIDPNTARAKDANSNDGAKFGNLLFSPTGKFLIYDYSGWEVSGTRVYDVVGKKDVKYMNDLSEGATVSFSKDDKYAMLWLAATESQPVKVYIFDTQSWKRTDVLGNDAASKDFLDVDVAYDPDRNVVMIDLYGTEEGDDMRSLEYALDNGKLSVVE